MRGLADCGGSCGSCPSAAGEVMAHGDLIPGNVLVCDGRLAGVIDVGGPGPADPALDLVGAWHLLEAGPRTATQHLFEADRLRRCVVVTNAKSSCPATVRDP